MPKTYCKKKILSMDCIGCHKTTLWQGNNALYDIPHAFKLTLADIFPCEFDVARCPVDIFKVIR